VVPAGRGLRRGVHRLADFAHGAHQPVAAQRVDDDLVVAAGQAVLGAPPVQLLQRAA